MRFQDAAPVGHEQYALQPFALAVVSLRVLRVVAHADVCGTIVLSIFSNKFNTKSGFFIH